MSPFIERGFCSDPNCRKSAVGKAWDNQIDPDKANPYCREHLELAEKLGCPIKLFSDTDVVIHDEEWWIKTW